MAPIIAHVADSFMDRSDSRADRVAPSGSALQTVIFCSACVGRFSGQLEARERRNICILHSNAGNYFHME